MIDFKYSLIAILIMGATTQFLRFFPFLIFSKKHPKFLNYLGVVLPFSIMAMLLVYSLKNINIYKISSLAEILSLIIIFIIHKWKHNYLFSIVLGTLCYMFLVQKIFIS